VAVHAPDGPVRAGHLGDQPGDQLGEVVGEHVADGVGDVAGGRARRARCAVALLEDLGVGAGAVLGRELDVAGVARRPLDRRGGGGQHLLGGHVELVVHVDLAGGGEGVDAGALGRAERLRGTVDVTGRGPAQGRDGAALDPLGYRPYRGEVAGGGLREAGLDYVDAQARELPGALALWPVA